MLKSLESITRIIAHLMLVATLGYIMHLASNAHDDWKLLSNKIGSAFSQNRVTIALEFKLPEGSKQEPASTTIANAFLQMVLPTKPANSTNSTP